jgi:1-deoxy-D-xylulose-5-phosphate synthase
MLTRMLRTALLHDDGPFAIRYPRGNAVGVEIPAEPETIELGRGELLAEGERVALVGYGTGVQTALGAAKLLSDQGITATVCDARFAKPLDAALLAELAAEHELVATIEENVLAGGFGSAVVEQLSDAGLLRDTRVLRFGIPDRYVTHGKPDLLKQEIELTPERVAGDVVTALERPRALKSA